MPSHRFGRRVLFPLAILSILLPLLAAFLPAFAGGSAFENLNRVLGQTRFWSSFSFGIKQAGASVMLALVLGLPGAWLLARYSFPGKRLLSALTVIPFSMPALIVAIAFVLYYGRNGVLNRLLMGLLSLEQAPLDFLYSFRGVVFAHAFYNFPLVMRLVADAWRLVPASQIDAARLLGAGNLRIFRTVTLPAILPAIGAAASLVFLLCFFSFVIVLLFAGPGIATPEVEIYRAARFEFDKPLASTMALMETLIALSVLAAYAWFERRMLHAKPEGVEYQKPVKLTGYGMRALAILYGGMVSVFLIGPLLAILAESFMVRSRSYSSASLGLANYGRLLGSGAFQSAAVNSLLLGLLSAALAAGLALSLFLFFRSRNDSLSVRILPMLPLAISGVVLAYGWTTILGGSSLVVIALVQAVSSFPFIFKAIQSSLGQADEKYLQAAMTLGSNRLSAFRRVSLPLALPALLSGIAFAFAISLGDANALIVAPVSGFDTMASYLYKLAGSYRFNDACAVSVILSVITAFVFFLKDQYHDKA